jgi:uncharacterized repeat protein (TIGR01451 family)
MTSLKRLTLCLALALSLSLSLALALTVRLDRASAQSGPPDVIAIGPAANSVSVPPSTHISVTFSHPMNPTTLTSRTLRVHGSMSGRLDGTLRYDDATRTATFAPTHDLKPGEWVAVNLTTAIRDITGTALDAPYGWTFVAQALNGSARFIPANPPRYGVGRLPYSVYGADLDQDGDVDLVTVNSYADTISILLNDGQGAFSPASPRDYAVGNGPYAVRGADLDGDGDVDLVTANRSNDTISVLLNDRDGHLTPATPRDYAVGDYPRSVCLADLDGDGDVDAVTANLSGDSISVLSNDGDGTFTPFAPRDYAVGDIPFDISCADLDGDGDVDLVTANLYSDAVSFLLNNGGGSFVPASPRDYFVGNYPRSVWGADWDGDGDVDLAISRSTGRLVILLNTGAGHFTSTVPGNLAVHDGPRSIRSADLDGDGDMDLVTTNSHSDDVSVLLNAGDGVFTPATPRDYVTGNGAYSVHVADLDGDADLDLAVADSYDDQVSILSNSGLEIAKTLLTPTGWPGLPVTYTLNYANYDSVTMRGAVITDQVPISLTNVHYTYDGPVITPTEGLTCAWQLAPLPPGATGVITLGATVNPALVSDSTLDNHAVIAHHGERLADTATLVVHATPKLWVDKSVEPLPSVEPGERFTYTIQVTVSGNLTTSGWLTDALPESTHFITATPGFASPTNGSPLTWTLPPGLHRPPSTFQHTVVLTAAGPARFLSNRARAVYPGVLTATDKAGIWMWSGVPTDTCQRDIALVFDRSGSMRELTRCYGCWDAGTGTTHPLPFGDHCDTSDPLFYQGYAYVSIEAEHYGSYDTHADYHWNWTQLPNIWWAMQRQPNRNASGPDTRSAWMMVGPHSGSALHYSSISDIVYPPAPYTTPRLDYEFTVPTVGDYYVWIRAQGGNQYWANSTARRSVHVGLNGTPMATGQTSQYGPYNDGASADRWRWTRVLRLDGLSAGTNYTLNFWAAGPGFRLDKIVLTNDARTNLMDDNHPLGWDYSGVSDAGPVETHGRTGWACLGPDSPTPDPRFVPVNPTTGELDDLYDDHQPLRAAKDAAIGFVRQMNPVLDQIAYVWYSSHPSIREELYCQEHYGSCKDLEYIVEVIESTYASGSTNIGGALWYGLLTLLPGQEPDPDPDGEGLPPGPPHTGPMHYGRPQTYGTLILLTDGIANVYPNVPSEYDVCYSDDLWPDQPDESDSQKRARECAVWFALRARDMGIAIHTIGLGVQADHELLAYVAQLTGGRYYFVPDVGDLYAVLEAIEAQTTSDCLLSGVEVAKRVTPQPTVTAGERLTYTIETTLSGWIRTLPLGLYDDVPDQTVFITATPGFVSEDPLVWSLPSGVFTEALTLTHTVVLSATGPAGMLTNTVSVVNDYFSGTGPVLSSDSAVLTVLPDLPPRPDLVVTQVRHGPDQPLTGQSLNFTVTVRNQGRADAPGWVAVELYTRDDGAGPPTGPADHAGGWCADPPACQQTRFDYLAFFHGLAVSQSRTLNYAITPDQAGSFQVYVQADVNQVSAATDEYGVFLESDESNNVFNYGIVTVWEVRPNKLYLPLIIKSLP